MLFVVADDSTEAKLEAGTSAFAETIDKVEVSTEAAHTKEKAR
ncbi:hypothetical protein BFV94_3024 [Alteromonas macleodii]|uniref:Uncharacterized protein n=1 Tax=Alteromonas macleodii TaxID=28108 RepID=A0AB36FRR4_ALTMA|nr:hypothetical protein BFV93_3012 [Alteromonas macleodii]OES30139.1 hypothetical protein BFV94_3024 [Alteromonas macleodii]OES30267.1 hypothetical protein BFV95_3024 [Alteromonas macleodii]OES40425.1 hypothetical protein BFV96_3009 [Alteromonas macleodii]